ncbi:MAG: S41 family peptidase [Ruminococcaceae bacterium]|nr:S41 family peptidase [Oscillospiraceae bacterium]
MSKKNCVILTAVVTFLATTIFYLTAGGTGLVLLLSKLGNDDGSLSKLNKIDAMLDRYYIGEMDKEKMGEMALTGYVYGVEDPYTSYVNEEEFADMNVTLEGDYVGIGVEVYVDSEDSLITVISAFDDSPAQKAGILPGDKIIGVEGTEVGLENYYRAINMIKGIEKTGDEKTVTLQILRGEEQMDITVSREKLSTQTVKDKIIEGDIGYIRISSFDKNTDRDFSQAVEKLTGRGIAGLVIDLRGNPGGVLDVVVAVADRVLPEGTIVTVRNKQGKEQVYSSDAACINLPISVLIDGNSASASEVLSGAIRDFGRGTLVGETSFGKGLVQSIFEFGDGTAMKITTAKYYTPSGECIDKTGIKPDIEIALPDGLTKPIQNLTFDEDIQLRKAVEVLR